MRFEEPSSMVRWDSPLFSIAPEDDITKPKAALQSENVGNAEQVAGEEESMLDQIWMAVTLGRQKGPTAATESVS